jgi:hypothetical protein
MLTIGMALDGVTRRTGGNLALAPVTSVIVGLAIILVAWIALAVSFAATKVPWSNEAWCAIPAVNLATKGYMGTTVLVSKGTWLKGVEQHTYWMMPLHLLAQAGWYKVVGFSLLRQRVLSVLFGVLALVSWFVILLRFSGRFSAALIACLLIGFERNFLNAAASGRMDMMAAALGACSIAAFLQIRRRSFQGALVASHSLAAAAIFTHPCGVLYAAALVITILYTLRSENAVRLTWNDVAIACAPYLIGAGLWGLYIAEAPADFHSQFFGNVSGFAGEYMQQSRFSGIRAPFRALGIELTERYFIPFGFGGLNTANRVGSAAWLTLCASTAFAGLLIKRLRSDPGERILALSGLTVFLLMTLLEGLKFQHYLVHSLPFLSALAAMTASELWQRRSLRLPVCIVLTLAIGFQSAAILHQFVRNPLKENFLPVPLWIQANIAPEESVIAPAELGYVLGFGGSLVDDVRLGLYTGMKPRFIVMSGWYRGWADNSERRDPVAFNHIRDVLDNEYRRVLAQGEYIVYERRDGGAAGGEERHEP